jgi:hypothetical protein
MGIKVLHIIKGSALDPQQFHLGSTKDIRCRTEYFNTRGIAYDELVSRRSYAGVSAEKLQAIELDQYKAVILEQASSPGLLRRIRRRKPDMNIIVRSHNAEFLHRLDYLKAEGLSRHIAGRMMVIGARSAFDFLCGKYSDYVLTITKWEKERYWSRFINKKRVKCSPFFLPQIYEATLPAEQEKKNQCVCLTSSSPNAFLVDAAKKFAAAIHGLKGSCPDWDFIITGDQAAIPVPFKERLKFTGFLESPYQLLAESRAMAIMSDYGYGFKTKILEAIMCKTYTIMPEKLYSRTPDEVKPYCVVVNPRSAASFQKALEHCARPFPHGNPNALFKEQAFAALDEVLGLKGKQ